MSLTVYLSINFQLTQNGKSDLLTVPLLSLTGLYLWWWLVGSEIVQSVRQVVTTALALGDQLILALGDQLTLALAVVEIGCKSIVWGVR